MIVLRSSLFMLYLALTSVLVVAALWLLCWLPMRTRRRLTLPWVHSIMWLIEHLLGIRMRVLGREHLPACPCVVLSKHQSAWETFALQTLFPMSAFVYKKELLWIPVFGWGLPLMPFVAIDRGAGKAALNQVAERGTQRLREGYSVIIFPEGTRVPPGQKRRYKIGGAYLAVSAGVPALPVALNSGECWGRRAFLKKPGLVTVSIGPAIEPAGKTPEEVNALAEAWIEAEMQRLSPHRYGHGAASPATAAAA